MYGCKLDSKSALELVDIDDGICDIMSPVAKGNELDAVYTI